MPKNMEMSMADDLFDNNQEETFLTFQRFSDMGLAVALSEKLSQGYFEYRLEKDAPALDAIWLGSSSLPDILLKIKASDFIKVHQFLEAYYKKDIDSIDATYYLYDFTNEELLDILRKPDEWGPLDYQLSQKILKERGVGLELSETQNLKNNRLEELSRATSGDSLVIICGIFIAYVFISLILMRITGFYNFPYSIFLILLAGSHLSFSKKTLPDGKQVYVFDEKDRKAGKMISLAGLIFLVYSILSFLLLAIDFSFGFFDFSF